MSNKVQSFPVTVEDTSTGKTCTVLDDEINMEDESKTPVGNRKHILADFYNYQRPKLRVCINDVAIEGLIDIGAGVSIITPES